LDSLYSTDNENLRDFHGLEGARGVATLSLEANSALESMAGLNISSELDWLAINDCPALVNIDALEPLETLATGLLVWSTGLENLDALRLLRSAPMVSVAANQRLVDASGLSSLKQVEQLFYRQNPVLRALPDLSSITDLGLSVLSILGNDALESVSLDFPNAPPPRRQVNGELRLVPADLIEIGDNARLQTISSPVGLASAQLLSIYANESLTEVDLGSFQHLDALAIDSNPNLLRLGLGGVEAVGSLEVTNNPKLSTAGLASLSTLDRTLTGNADADPDAAGDADSMP
jgi:hypothetical protein